MTNPTLMRLKAMTNRHSRRLEGREREKAVAAATLLKLETERQLRDVESELRFLESKPATVKADFKFPPSPRCPCSLYMQPVAVFDCGELWLEWGCNCGSVQSEPQIEWPWVEEYVWTIDAAAAGLRVE